MLFLTSKLLKTQNPSPSPITRSIATDRARRHKAVVDVSISSDGRRRHTPTKNLPLALVLFMRTGVFFDPNDITITDVVLASVDGQMQIHWHVTPAFFSD
jgi:hypothetical protein